MAESKANRPSRGRRPLVAVTGERRAGRVLVLGAGFIGSHVTRHLVQAGYRVDVVTRSEPRAELAPLLDGASVALGDLTTMTAVTALLAQVDHVVYALGSSSPVESDLDPASDVSLVVPPVVRLLELLRLRSSVGVTFLSSGGAVYGHVDGRPADEDAQPEPISSYGILKWTAERYLRMYSDLYGVPVRILRVANVYGPGQVWAKGQGIVARLMRCVLAHERFTVYGTGNNVRDYVYIDDVSQVVADLIGHEKPPPLLNVGSGVGYSVTDIVGLVEEISGQQIDLEYLPARPFDVGSIVLDVGRVSRLLDYQPVDLCEGLARTWRSVTTAQVSDRHGQVRMPGSNR